MSKTKISEFSTTPGNNTDINGINIAEGCAPSGINNAIRELMSDLKEWQSGAMDVYVIPQGTAAAPGIQLYGDLDTGLYGFAANQLGVAVGGASAGYFSSAGWVGNVVATTVDLTNIEVTNIKAKDGTTSISLADSTGIATFSKSTVIETTDNTNAALRITQLGTGNALLVEDATNPDTTPTVIDQFGNVILGTTARTTPITSKIEIHGTASELSGLSPSLGFYHWSATASLSSTLTFRHYPSGTVGTLAANTSGDVLGRIVFLSYDGTNAFGAVIRGVSGTGGTAPSITYDASGGHNFTNGPIDVENLEVTNIKARDGTAAASIADSTGAITVTKDLTANGVTLGKGLGSVLTNTALGRSALAANTAGDLNTAVGNLSLTSNIGGTGNTAVGHVAMTSHQGGSLNTAVGAGSLTANLNGNNNTAIGQSALGTATGSNNTAVGSAAGSLITNGNKNTIIGNYDGNQGGLDIRTASNYIVLSDGDGNPRAYWNGADATFGGSLTATTITGTQVNSDNLRLDGNTLSSTDTSGNIIIAPNGSGQVHISNTAAAGLYQEIASNSRTPGISSLQVGQGVSGEAYVVNRANNYLVLGANGAERARISANGVFRIKGAGTAGTSDAVVINQSAPTDSFVINASGQVGIGTSTLLSTLTVSAAGASQALVSTTGTNGASSSFSNTGGTVGVGINSSAATPAYAAYISHSGTYPISFYTDSVERARINSDGILSGWSGTNSAPTFSYTNDPNTGMYFPATDAVGFATGGTEIVRITSTGLQVTNIKAKDGTASITLADSTGQATFSANPLLNAGTANGVLYLNASKVATSGSALTFDGTVLTASASASVTGNFKTTSSAAQVSNLTASNDANTTIGLGVFGSAAGSFGTLSAGTPFLSTSAATMVQNVQNASGVFVWGIGATPAEQMRLTSTGLGIGTSSPQTGLSLIKYGSQWTNHTSNPYPQPAGNTFLQMEAVAAQDNWFGFTGSYGATSGSVNLLLQVNLNNINQQAGNYIASEAQSATAADLTFGKMVAGATTGANSAKSEQMRISSDGTFRVKGAGTAGSTDAFQISGSAPADAARLTSDGNLLLGTTALLANANYFASSPGNAWSVFGHVNGTTSGVEYVKFYYNNGQIGSVTQNGTTAVAYNTSSDYRLKNITGPITTSGAYIDSLNPVEGTWKADGSTFVGLIAHEVQEVSRTTVATGTKDGEEMQGMDYSSAELIANMLAELQSLRARVAKLEAK
jgi:hypothetical protein